MSVSTINDSKLDLPNNLEVQNNQTAFRAAVPYIAEYLTLAVVESATAVVAFNANYLVLGAFCSVSAIYATAALASIAIVIRASNNALEFNEVIKSTLDKVYKIYFVSVIVSILIVH